MFARLGLEAADALEEFLELALDYERREPPSLQGFMAWLRSADAVVKRDMEISRDEVRVMTVHGAKGLEAPVVILADTTTPPTGPHPMRLLAVPALPAAPDAPPCLVWVGRQKDDVDAVAAAREAASTKIEHEHRRLLYVAMTRAAERLIVCGYEGKKRKPAGCWYDLVLGGLAGQPGFQEIGDGDARLWRYRVAPDLVAPDCRAVGEPRFGCARMLHDQPAWLTAAGRRRDRPGRDPHPSTAYDETAAAAPIRLRRSGCRGGAGTRSRWCIG